MIRHSAQNLTKLAELIYQPLAPHIDSARDWIISPDGSLWLVPWAALPVEPDTYALERHTIRYLISGRELVTDGERAKSQQPGLALADPDFDAELKNTEPQNQNPAEPKTEDKTPPTLLAATSSRGAAPGLPTHWARLPGTASELSATLPKLERYFGASPLAYTGAEATEAAFKQSQRPRVVVLSTHGFALPDENVPAKPAGKTPAGKTPAKPAADKGRFNNPLLRCGLVLAGANRTPAERPAGSDDGILTGLEIVGTDLRGTELVVLSACETGLGELRSGEGVAGLRQAFQLAGARSVVSTLWQIPDQETAWLMTRFWENLAAGLDAAEALRDAQLLLLNQHRQLAQLAARNETAGLEKLLASRGLKTAKTPTKPESAPTAQGDNPAPGRAHPLLWAAFTLTGPPTAAGSAQPTSRAKPVAPALTPATRRCPARGACLAEVCPAIASDRAMIENGRRLAILPGGSPGLIMRFRLVRTAVLLVTALGLAATDALGQGDSPNRPTPPKPGVKSARKKTPPRTTPPVQTPVDKEALAQRVRDYISRVRELEKQGKAREAVPIARKLVEAQRELCGADAPDTASALDCLGMTLLHAEDVSAAESYLQSALDIRRKHFGENSTQTAASLNNLGLLFERRGLKSKAREYYERSLLADEAAVGPDGRATAVPLSNLGQLLSATGELVAARAYLERALSIYLSSHGEKSRNTVVALCNLGQVLDKMGEHDKARPHFNRALAIQVELTGENHPDTAMVYERIAKSCDLIGDLAGTRTNYERALSIRRKTQGESSRAIAIAYNNFARALQEEGDYAGSRQNLEQALSVYLKTVGDRHPLTATALDNLGAFYAAIGDGPRARSCFRQALAIERAQPEQNLRRISGILTGLGSSLVEEGDWRKPKPASRKRWNCPGT